MKIALLTYSTRPRGGVVHTLALAEALVAAGASATVWTLGRGANTTFFRAVDPRVEQVVVPMDERDDEEYGARILRSIEVLRTALHEVFGAADRGGYDIVHAQDCISANAAGPRCVRTVHHIDHFTTPELAACHERAIVEPYAHICVSAAVAAELRAGWGIKATVIPNGVHAARFATAAGPGAQAVAARAAWRQRLGRYVLTVGGIEPRKGSIELLDAYALLRAVRPDIALAVAGGETLFDYRDYRARWRQRTDELGLAPTVLGPIDDHDLPALVAAATAFAFPSTREGFGLAAMEALAAGVPVVTSDLPVLREVFADAVAFAGTPAELAAALRRAIDYPDPIRQATGRALADRFTWEAAAAAHLALYDTLAESPAAGIHVEGDRRDRGGDE